jgi:DNA excision repair protein ERCC-4
MMLPAELPREAITVLIDSREQLPYSFPGMNTEVATLTTGDFSLKGFESIIAIERKSIDDLVMCCGRQRQRFDREIQRLLAYPVRALVVEADWHDIALGEWRSKLTPRQVASSLISFQVRGLPVVMAGDRDMAEKLTAGMLRRAAIHRYREMKSFLKEIAK